MYTTNINEGVNRTIGQSENSQKQRSFFFKRSIGYRVCFIANDEIQAKWTMLIHDFGGDVYSNYLSLINFKKMPDFSS
jgi:hypothetical protein